MAIIIGDNAPTWAEVDAAIGSLEEKEMPEFHPRGPRPQDFPCARFRHDDAEIALIPVARENSAMWQGVLEHVAREHAKVSAYIGGVGAGDRNGTVLVLLATRSTDDMGRVLDGVIGVVAGPSDGMSPEP